MSNLEFGDIYWIPKNRHRGRGISQHHVVILYADRKSKLVYFQTLSSRMYKVFRNFGSFNNNNCNTCSEDKKRFKEFTNRVRKNRFLDVDHTVFLNHGKYDFLTKETYICYSRISKDNYFYFKSNIDNGTYSHRGSMLPNNGKCTIIALKEAPRVSTSEIGKIIRHYQA